MTEAQLDLARRAVACKGWRWMPGMRTYGGFLLVAQHECDGWLGVLPNDTSGVLFRVAPDATPDLSDAATLGCFLALVREAWEEPLLGVAFDFECGEWAVRLWNGSLLRKGFGASEAEALVAALEAAHAEGGDRREEE